MKLVDEFRRESKYLVYDMYERIVYNTKDYDSISRAKMLDEILREYKLENYLFNICTGKEMEFLKKFINKKLEEKDIKKYYWEIHELNRKGIFSKFSYEVFEEQRDNVKSAIKLYDKYGKKGFDNMFTTMIGIIKVNGELLDEAFVSLVSSLADKVEDEIHKVMRVPIFHFYCNYGDIYISSQKEYEDTIYFRDYEYLLDDIDKARKEIGIGGTFKIEIDMYSNIFYYDLNISKKKSKELYDFLHSGVPYRYYKRLFDEARILNNYEEIDILIKDNKIKKLFYDALNENPCAAMNGCTPKQRNDILKETADLKSKYNSVPQKNAHLNRKEANKLYDAYFALIEYTNNKYSIVKSIKKIYKQDQLDSSKIMEINKYLFEHRDIIDDFVRENKYKFNKEMLDIVKDFKNAVVDSYFKVVRFDEEYTQFLSSSNKLYMVKGVNTNFDNLINKEELPKFIGTTLLPYKGNIVYNGLFIPINVNIGSDLLKEVDRNYDKAIKYYHL